MTVYINQNFKKRNYETSNIVYCVSETEPTTAGRWIEEDRISVKQIQSTMDTIYSEGGATYYGWL